LKETLPSISSSKEHHWQRVLPFLRQFFLHPLNGGFEKEETCSIRVSSSVNEFPSMA
jgi:hypothetical protein